MGSVFKRPEQDKKGKKGKWTIAWTDENRKRQKKTCGTDKKAAEAELARMEREVEDIKLGLTSRSRSAQIKAASTSIKDHLDEYRQALIDKGGTDKHANNIRSALDRLFVDAKVVNLSDISTDRIAKAVGRIRATKSARTANHARGAMKAFAKWLLINGRIAEIPLPILALPPHNEKLDPKRVRRAISHEELERLLGVVEASEPRLLSRRDHGVVPRWLTGPERAALYRLAIGTGFRANELRTLTPERFDLDSKQPSITVLAENEKNRKGTVQPITRELAEKFRPFLAGKPPGQPVLEVPEKAAALLYRDLALAGIPKVDSEGQVLDFHALRASYITHLINSGANPKVVQTLARHSTVMLTLERYTKLGAGDLRRALEGMEGGGPEGRKGGK